MTDAYNSETDGYKKLLFKKIINDFESYTSFVSELEKLTNIWLDAVSKKDYNLAGKHALDLALYHEDNKKRLTYMKNSFGEFEDLKDAEDFYSSSVAKISGSELPEDLDTMKVSLADLISKALNLINKEAEIMSKLYSSDEPCPEYIFTIHYLDLERSPENTDVMFA